MNIPHDPNPQTFDAMAIAQHEMYEAWIRAGFVEEQAFGLLLASMGQATK